MTREDGGVSVGRATTPFPPRNTIQPPRACTVSSLQLSFPRPLIQPPSLLSSPSIAGPLSPLASLPASRELPRLVKLANIAPQVVTPHCLLSDAASSTSAAFHITERITLQARGRLIIHAFRTRSASADSIFVRARSFSRMVFPTYNNASTDGRRMERGRERR